MDADRPIVAQPSTAADPIVPSRDAHVRHTCPACRLCRRPLTALQRRHGDVCDAMDCRRRAVDDLRRTERTAALDMAVRQAAGDWNEPALRTAPVMWLRDHDTRLVAVSAAELTAQREFLRALEVAAAGPDARRDDAGPATVEPIEPDTAPTLAHHLCAFCGGRCCRAGGDHHAYLRAEDLRRWLLRRPAGTWAEAVDDYVRLVPDRHVADSCLHHGERGCTLPRALRSRTCNAYACDALADVRKIAAAEPAARVVVATVKAHRLRDAAVMSANGTRALP